MNYYDEIKNKLIDNEVYSKVKDYSKEIYRVRTYFEIGKLLNEAGKHYGNNIIEKYAEKLVEEVGKKYNKRTLFRMKQFYIVFSNEKVSPLGTQLTWSHYRALLPLKDYEEINYYIQISIANHLSKTELEQKIKSKEYQRLDQNTRNKLIMKEKVSIKELVPNPIIIKNNHNELITTEKVLHKIIMDDIESFMNELGNNFCFVGSEYKIKIGDRYNYIDLLLYNIKYHCYIVIELKVTEYKAEYVGQILKYMNFIDKNIKSDIDDETVGIIICKKENKYVIEYCSDDRIIAREYKIV